MEQNVMGELNVYRESGARPGSEIARRHGMDVHTVARVLEGGRGRRRQESREGSSAFDPLGEEIRAGPAAG